MNNRRILKNIGISMLVRPLSMMLSMVYVPMLLAFLGDAKYGVWAIIGNVSSWINSLDIGIGNGLRNKLAEAYSLDDEESMQKYVSTAYLGTAVVSVLFFLLLTLAWKVLGLSAFFNLSLSGENVDLVVAVSVFFVCINFVLALSKTCAYSMQKPGILSVIGVITQVIQIVAIFFLSKGIRENLMTIAVMSGIIGLLDSFIVYRVLIKKHPYIKPNIRNIDLKYMKPLLTLGLGFFVMQICSLVLNTTDNLLISNLFGSAEVTPYNMVYKVFYIPVQIHAIIIMPMWSAYTEASAKKDMAWIKSTMRKINWVTILFSVGIVTGVFLFEPFAAIWLGRSLEYGMPLIVSVAAYMVAQMFANNYSSFLCGVGYIKISSFLSMIGAILNIPLSVYFAKNCQMGLAGIILGSLCIMLVNVVVLPFVTARWISAKKREWGVNDGRI